MPDQRLTDLTELTTPADDDVLYIVDVSDTTDSAGGTSKKALVDNVRGWPQTSAESSAGVTPTNYQYEPGNVLRYGTNTTPGTTDMSTAIQNAILSMEQDSGTVIVPEGTYLISQQIEITAPVTIQGEGWGSIFTCASASTFIFFLAQDLVAANPLDGVVFRDFQIDANASGQLDAGIIQANNCVLRCYNLRLKDGSRASGSQGVNGISCSKSSGTAASSGVIKDCLITGFSKAPINVTSGSEEFLVEGNTCHSNTGNGETSGIQINGGLGEVKVIGNTCYNNEGRGIIVTVVGTTPPQIPDNIIVSGNTCYGNGTGTSVGDGIFVGNAFVGTAGKIFHAVIANNICHDNGLTTSGTGSGILVENMQHITLSGNRCHENGVNGIKIDTCDNVLVEGNACYNNNNDVLSNASGLVIDACTEVEVHGNHFYDTQGTITQDYGIYFDAESDRVTIQGNVIEDHDVGLIGGGYPTDSVIIQDGHKVQTTDATVTNIFIATLPDECAATLEAEVIAKESDASDRAMYRKLGLFYRDAGGSATQQGSTQDLITDEESDATWGGTTLGVTSTAIRARIQGVASQTVDWFANITLRIR